MEPIKAYNKIIEHIERLAHRERELPNKEIIDRVIKEAGYSVKDLSAILKFFVGKSLNEYIRERKMNFMYGKLREGKTFDAEKLLSYGTYSDQPALIKAFKKQYNMTPKQAFESSENLSIAPSTIDYIYEKKDGETKKEKVSVEMGEEMTFGISTEQYNKILEASGYKEVYGFNEAQGNVSYWISEEYHIPLKDAFGFVDDMGVYLERECGIRVSNMDEKKLKAHMKRDEDILKISYCFDLSVTEVIELRAEFAVLGLNLFKMDLDIIALYMRGNLPLVDFWENYQFYLDHEDEFKPGEILL